MLQKTSFKLILFTSVLSIVTSCGKGEPLNHLGELGSNLVKDAGSVVEQVGQIPREVGKAALGLQDVEDDIEDNADRISELEKELLETQQLLDSLYVQVDNLEGDVDVLEQLVALNQKRIIRLKKILRKRETIKKIIDPCGDKPGSFDEVVFKTSKGRFLAYFEAGGGKRFLSLLPDGVYVTTDAQRCRFEISGMKLID